MFGFFLFFSWKAGAWNVRAKYFFWQFYWLAKASHTTTTWNVSANFTLFFWVGGEKVLHNMARNKRTENIWKLFSHKRGSATITDTSDWVCKKSCFKHLGSWVWHSMSHRTSLVNHVSKGAEKRVARERKKKIMMKNCWFHFWRFLLALWE